MKAEYDILIVGGGPAGLSAALIAGRALLRVLIIDGGTPRNTAAPAMHSYLSRDGILPRDFRAEAAAELVRYQTIEHRDGLVHDIQANDAGLIAHLTDGASVSAAKVILALGLVDRLPDIQGLASNWGRGVHHCPFCDGFEHRGSHWGVLAEDPTMLGHALFLQNWASSLTVFTDGQTLPAAEVVKMRDAGIRIAEAPIERVLSGDGPAIGGILLQDGSKEAVTSLWVRPRQEQTSLVRHLQLSLGENGAIERDEAGETAVPGLYAAGDCAAGPMQQAILAAADGGRIMFGLVRDLITARHPA
jgi:thioredoxin reductase